MRYRSILFIAVLGCASQLASQDANPLSTELKQNYDQRKERAVGGSRSHA